MNREEAILRELNLYPPWQRREQTRPDSEQRIETVQPVLEDVADRSVMEKADVPMSDNLGWTELKATVKNCTACRLRATCTQTVFGTGDVQADWLFVGEWPGADEDIQGEPFAGEAGRLFDNMLAAIKLERGRNVYTTNFIKCYPHGNHMPEAGEIARCAPYWERQIQLIQPKLIIALGEATARLLGHHAALSDLRGNVHDYRGLSSDGLVKSIPLIVTHHPAYLLQNPLKKSEAWDDLCLAVATVQGLV